MKILKLNYSYSSYKQINYLLQSVNLSFDLIVGLKPRKIYRLLKKVSKVSESFNFSKQEMKELSFLISSGVFRKKITIIRIFNFIFKFKKQFSKFILFEKLFLISLPFLGVFFDKKQIIRC